MCIQALQAVQIPSLHTEHYPIPGAGRCSMSKDIDVLFESMDRKQKKDELVKNLKWHPLPEDVEEMK